MVKLVLQYRDQSSLGVSVLIRIYAMQEIPRVSTFFYVSFCFVADKDQTTSFRITMISRKLWTGADCNGPFGINFSIFKRRSQNTLKGNRNIVYVTFGLKKSLCHY